MGGVTIIFPEQPNQTKPNQSRSLSLQQNFLNEKIFSLRGLQEVKKKARFITTSTMQRKKKSTKRTQLSQVSAAPLQQWPTARARVAVEFLLEPAGAKKNTENRKQKGQLHRNTHEASNTQRKNFDMLHTHTHKVIPAGSHAALTWFHKCAHASPVLPFLKSMTRRSRATRFAHSLSKISCMQLGT